MARILLTAGQEFGTIGQFTPATQVFGTADGSETVLLTGNSTAVFDQSFNKGGDTIRIDGVASDYSVVLNGSNVVLTSANGANIVIPVGASGLDIQFSDATRELRFDEATSTVVLGEQIVGNTASPVEPGDAGVSGQTFVLTPDGDIIPGLVGSRGTTDTSGDDLIVAGSVATGGGGTVNGLGAGDNINGGEGNDTLRIVAETTGNDPQILNPTITSVERVEVQNLTFGDTVVVNLTNATDVNELSAYNSSAISGGDVVFTDVRDNALVSTDRFTGEIEVNFISGALAGGELGLAVKASDVYFNIDTDGDAVNVLNIDTSGAASYVTVGLDGEQVEDTLNITGDGVALELDEDDNEFELLTKVDATAFTGALDIDLSDNYRDVTFDGGAGKTTLVIGGGDNDITTQNANDVVNVAQGGDQVVDLGGGDDLLIIGTALTIDDSLDGGAGNDTLQVDVDHAGTIAVAQDITNFEVLQLVGSPAAATPNVQQGEDITVDLEKFDNISNVTIATSVEAGTAEAEVQIVDFDESDAYGTSVTIEGLEIEIPANLDADQVAAYVYNNYADQIIGAYNSNHPGDELAQIELVNGDQLRLTYTALSGDVSFISVVGNTDPLTAGVTFGPTATPTPGTDPVDEVQTLTIDTAPTTNGDVTVTVNGTPVTVTLVGGETTIETAARIVTAINNLANVTATSSGSVVTITYDATLGDVAAATFVDTDTTGAAATEADVANGVAPVVEEQTVQITGAADGDGGWIRVDLGGNFVDIEIPANATIDQIGGIVAGAINEIQANIPEIASVNYNTANDTITFTFTEEAGDVPDIVVSGTPGNHVDVYDAGSSSTEHAGVDGSLDGILTIDNMASGGTVTLAAMNSGLVNVVVDDNTTSDELNINLDASYVYDANGTYDFDGFEALNFNTIGTTQEQIHIASNDATSVTVAGTVGIVFDDTFTNLVSFDATGISGAASAANKGVSVSTSTTSDAEFTGGSGNDYLQTGSGSDTIDAGAGNDVLIGGAGADTLTGGAGSDAFTYLSVTDSQGNIDNVDQITDFQAGTNGDTIDLSAITGVLVGGAGGEYTGVADGYGAVLTSLNGGGDAQAVFDTSTNTLYVDINGDAILNDSDMAININVTGTLTSANFNFG